MNSFDPFEAYCELREKECRVKKDANLHEIPVGKARYYVACHFGNTPIEGILKDRLLHRRDSAPDAVPGVPKINK